MFVLVTDLFGFVLSVICLRQVKLAMCAFILYLEHLSRRPVILLFQ